MAKAAENKVINKLGATEMPASATATSSKPLKGKDTRREGDMENGIRKVVVIKGKGKSWSNTPSYGFDIDYNSASDYNYNYDQGGCQAFGLWVEDMEPTKGQLQTKRTMLNCCTYVM